MAFPTLWPKQGMKILGFVKASSNAKKAKKVHNVIKLAKVMKVSKAKKVISMPKAAKATQAKKVSKTKKVMKKTLKKKSIDTYRVVNFLHLGLGLKIGRCYTKSHLQTLCAGDLSKLKRLRNLMRDATKLRPEANASDVDHGTETKKFNASNVDHGKETKKIKSKRVSQKVVLGKHISELQKTSKTNKTDSKRIKMGMAKAYNPKETSAPKPSQQKSIAKQDNNKTKSQDEDIAAGLGKKALTLLTLRALEKLYNKHKKNSLGTETVKDTLAQAKEELISKQLVDLKCICKKKKLAFSGTKTVLVKRLLGQKQEMLKGKMVRAIPILEGIARSKAQKQEAKERADARKQKEKIYNAACKLKKEVSCKTHNELKDVLKKYGLKVSGSKEECVERIVAREREEGEVERILAERAARARKQELLSMSAASLMKECSKSKDVLEDSLLKQVMLDRLLMSETKSAALVRHQRKVLDSLKQ